VLSGGVDLEQRGGARAAGGTQVRGGARGEREGEGLGRAR